MPSAVGTLVTALASIGFTGGSRGRSMPVSQAVADDLRTHVDHDRDPRVAVPPSRRAARTATAPRGRRLSGCRAGGRRPGGNREAAPPATRLSFMTTSVGVHEAKTHLSRLLEKVAAGEEVEITNRGKVVARLVGPARRTPNFDFDRGRVWIADDFDDDFPEELQRAFEGEE